MGLASPAANRRGSALLIAHLHALDPEAPLAVDRLSALLGRELAYRLVFALATPASRRGQDPLAAYRCSARAAEK